MVLFKFIQVLVSLELLAEILMDIVLTLLNGEIPVFIIHPCDPTVVICNLIWPCDIAVCITYLISHSSSLPYNLRIFQFGCIINTKLPSCGDIIRCTSLGFPSWFSESTRSTDSCFPGTSCENLMMYGRLYQHIRVVLYISRMPGCGPNALPKIGYSFCSQ